MNMQYTLISITAIEYDIYGNRVLTQDPGNALVNEQGYRRTTRTACLDGTTNIFDGGYCVADRNITVITDTEHLEWFRRMVSLYSLVRVSVAEGVYIGSPHRFATVSGRAKLEILIQESCL